jgi:cytochrome c oxidase subunit 4
MANENNEDDKAKSEPPAAAKHDSVPAKAKSEAPNATPEPVKAKSEPPNTTAEPVKAKSEPPVAKSEPPAAKSESPAAKSEPPVAKSTPPTSAEEHEEEEAAEAKASEPPPEPPQAVTKSEAPKPKKKKPVEAKAAREEHHEPAPDAHGHAAAGHGVNRREYIVMFFVLATLTALEVGIVKVPGIDKLLVRIGLVALALTKAALVGLYYMHLKHETRTMKLYAMVPFAAPALYAVVLISEAAWRLTRW